jgi:hypothetical protein
MSRDVHLKLHLEGLKNPDTNAKAAIALWSALVATLLRRELLQNEDIEFMSEEALRLTSAAFDKDTATRQVVDVIIAALVASTRETEQRTDRRSS